MKQIRYPNLFCLHALKLQLTESSMNEAIILAGGLGTRLRSEVRDLPKVLAPVAGRPFIAYILDQLAQQSFSRVILATGYRADQVEAVLGTRWGPLILEYSREDEPLGTGGAIREALRHCRTGRVAAINGDTYLKVDYGVFEDRVAKEHTMIGMALAW
ncbi:D-glycero-d-manno-heptose 1-phosphate guanosyltransferase, partial [mine drainage metagenome]